MKLLHKEIEIGKRYVLSEPIGNFEMDKETLKKLEDSLFYWFDPNYGAYRYGSNNVIMNRVQIREILQQLSYMYMDTVEIDGDKYSGPWETRFARYLYNNYNKFALAAGHREVLQKCIDQRGLYDHRIEVEFADRIDFGPGEFDNNPSSCWWKYESYSQGRVRFMHEMKKGRAFALKIYANGAKEGRMWIIKYAARPYFFNHYYSKVGTETMTRLLKKFFDCDACEIPIDVDYDNLYINTDAIVFGRKLDGIRRKTRVNIENWAADYTYDAELEEDRERHLGGVTCCDCGERIFSEDDEYYVEGYGTVCDNCYSHNFAECTHCGKIYSSSDIEYVRDYGDMCGKCMDRIPWHVEKDHWGYEHKVYGAGTDAGDADE